MSKRKRSSRAANAANKKAKTDAFKGDFGMQWQAIENVNGDETFYVCDSSKIKGNSKIIAFDMDHTLVKPSSGAKFPQSRGDWEWLDDTVKPKLEELNKEGVKIVIFTNQGGIEKKRQKLSDITGKILDIARDLGFPIQGYIAAAEDAFRKPNTTMWDRMVSDYNDGVEIDVDQCMYVGDAAGRAKGWNGTGSKKDFSCGDRKFAFNVGVEFQTPEEFFFGEEPTDKWEWGGLDPKAFLEEFDEDEEQVDLDELLSVDDQEMIINVGQAASGKSRFAKKHFVPKGYVHINRDTLHTAAKCIKSTKAALAEGKSVIIDNTNPDAATRAKYLALAENAGITARALYFDTSKELSAHLNYFRVKMTNGATRRVPMVAYRIFWKKLAPPTEDEGFEKVYTIKFVPHFDNDDEKRLFLQRV